ncbi:MAG: queuosine precursor transporter [Myxococcaceae bacterium]
MNLDTRGKLFLSLSALFVTALVIGDVIGGKLTGVPLFGSVHFLSVGFIPFPITFLLTDLLNEFYGKQAARTVTWVGFGMAVFTLIILTIAVAVPWHPETLKPEWTGLTPAPYDSVFASGRRILIASMTAYVVAQLIDIAVFHKLKSLTGGKLLWLRATGSTVVSQLIDTMVIQTMVWSGNLDMPKLVNLVFTSWVGKILIAILLTPLIYAGHAFVERVLKIEPQKPDPA